MVAASVYMTRLAPYPPARRCNAPHQTAPGRVAGPFGQQPVDQLPWGHSSLIFAKCSSVAEARFYLAQTLQQGWSRDVLALQQQFVISDGRGMNEN